MNHINIPTNVASLKLYAFGMTLDRLKTKFDASIEAVNEEFVDGLVRAFIEKHPNCLRKMIDESSVSLQTFLRNGAFIQSDFRTNATAEPAVTIEQFATQIEEKLSHLRKELDDQLGGKMVVMDDAPAEEVEVVEEEVDAAEQQRILKLVTEIAKRDD